MYVLRAWQQVAGPERTINTAIDYCLEYDSSHLIIEANQGGDTWAVIVRQLMRQRGLKDWQIRPELVNAPTNKSKIERANQLLVSYETDKIVHVGYHKLLESTLRQFPITKPYDLVDALWHAWNDLLSCNY